MHMRKQRRRSALVTAKLISTFVFATWIIRFLYFLHPEFQTSSHLLWQYEGGSESSVIGIITLLINMIGCCIIP